VRQTARVYAAALERWAKHRIETDVACRKTVTDLKSVLLSCTLYVLFKMRFYIGLHYRQF